MFAYSTDGGATWNNPANNPAPFVGASIAIAGNGTAIPLKYYHPNVLDVTGNGWDLATPVITPLWDGFAVAYANNRDIHPFHVHWVGGIGGSWIPKPLLTPTPGAATTDLRMPSLASRDDFTGQGWERIHFCYESDYGNGKSTIFYWPIQHALDYHETFAYGSFTPFGWAVEVNRPYWSCVNMHPHVAVVNDPKFAGAPGLGIPIVTWETFGNVFPPWLLGVPPLYTRSAAMRYMTSSTTPTAWSEITTFHNQIGTLNNLSQPVVRPLDFGPAASEYAEVAYQDTLSHQEFIARLTSPWFAYPSMWKISRLVEYAQWGSVSLPYEQDPSEDFGSIFYRGIYSDANGLYAAKLVANPDVNHLDEVSTPAENALVWHIGVRGKVQGGPSPCGPPIIGIGISPGYPRDGIFQAGQLPIVTPIFINRPLASFIEVAAPYDSMEGGGGNYDSSSGNQYSSDSTADLVEQPPWPITEDSVRTEYFPANQQQVVSLRRLLIVDTSQLQGLLPSAANQVTYKLVMKDSATGQVEKVLDSAIIRGQSLGGVYPGINPNDSSMMGMGYRIFDTIQPTLSGSAYVTAIIIKDPTTIANLASEVEYGDSLDFPSPVTDSSSSDSGGFKRAQPQGSGSPQQELEVTVHPNPVRGTVRICVTDLPEGIPATVDVVNEMGVAVATLYNATPDAELGLCLQLDCSNLPSGTYYADLQTQGAHKAVKFSVQH